MSEQANHGAMSDDLGAYDFTTLCTPHYQALVNYAGRLLPGRPAEARDLVQEAFLRAVRTWSRWRPSTGEDPSRAARGWLHRIVQNVFLDESRAHSGHRKLLDDHHAVVLEHTYGTEDDCHLPRLSDGIGDEVRQALSELDHDQRDIVVRADFGGEQYLAIADALGIPLGTVMSRLHRGRKRLAAVLQSYAKAEYNIYRKDIVIKRPRRLAHGTQSDLNCAGSTALADVTSEPVETESDCIDSVVTGYDRSDLFQR